MSFIGMSIRSISSVAIIVVGTILSGQTFAAETKANKLFGAKASASRQSSKALGSYAKGCLAGAEQLPESGPTWQAMRLSRNRNWGHPELIGYLKRLSAEVAAIPGWKGLYIGDLSQPRGGPMTSSHQSHQLGLDADIWLLPPKRLNLSRAERENLSSKTVRANNHRTVNNNWTPAHMAVLKAAASDPAVDRIFITAPAKIWMCNNAKGNRKWLQKVRPYWGHHYHFHVRLKCPKGSKGCKTQTPTVRQLSKNATGCDKDLNWWVTAALAPPDPNAPKPPKKPKKRGARDYVMADLPSQCRKVLNAQ
jgi:penicillin-insensitive murein endopeptidase